MKLNPRRVSSIWIRATNLKSADVTVMKKCKNFNSYIQDSPEAAEHSRATSS